MGVPTPVGFGLIRRPRCRWSLRTSREPESGVASYSEPRLCRTRSAWVASLAHVVLALPRYPGPLGLHSLTLLLALCTDIFQPILCRGDVGVTRFGRCSEMQGRFSCPP
ncbi:hypothetical protein PsYK624_016040 [Phanerochaete sordida]|uniref:Uncharacterized protein n=1 Tax=Phanerochaete sordida TaxID=48140 RepID=A0A9P3L7Z4_9APHY|nr:hypothetical protein PsYK624_016040 [Phanerochaete sordida]